jgi:hypothetical protein
MYISRCASVKSKWSPWWGAWVISRNVVSTFNARLRDTQPTWPFKRYTNGLSFRAPRSVIARPAVPNNTWKRQLYTRRKLHGTGPRSAGSILTQVVYNSVLLVKCWWRDFGEHSTPPISWYTVTPVRPRISRESSRWWVMIQYRQDNSIPQSSLASLRSKMCQWYSRPKSFDSGI